MIKAYWQKVITMDIMTLTDVSKIKDKKMQYFYKFPEFVTLRSEIRSNFEREIK